MIAKSKGARWSLFVLLSVGLLYGLLLIPDPSSTPPLPGDRDPFVWDQDAYWSQLETGFTELKSQNCWKLTSAIDEKFAAVRWLLQRLELETLSADAAAFAELETAFFELAMYLGACPDRLTEYLYTSSRLRQAVKAESRYWDINSPAVRNTIYRLLYGSRMATEEVMMQSSRKRIPAVVMGVAEPSATPGAKILDVEVHSGDLLVSRGGAPTSALIARGNDYPGNFSHAALLHVDENTNEISIIESHIEIGVAVADLNGYFSDTKLRVMVLRLRADLPEMTADPMLPHKAAEYALNRARTERIPYDFSMDTEEPSQLFCSEVASDAYKQFDVQLWAGLSYISSIGVRSWLGAFGVEHFITQEPSDLEYDPQLRVVAEWRDFETLHQDRLDNAVVDVMLEAAERGEQIQYHWYMLPFGRLAKGYSWLLNRVGCAGPVPEGMNATAAMKNEWFSARHHTIREMLREMAAEFKESRGYEPPYWELIKMAREAELGIRIR